uniref:Uncharacterized protein n=1 Tax=Acrobeloides nanus TaxID=290746 RepID=A0A914CFJ0_9BILA
MGSKFLSLLFVIAIANAQIFDNDPWYTWNVGKGAAGSSSVMGYPFDGPIERLGARAYRYATTSFKVTDCNTFCHYYYGRGGSCQRTYGGDCSTYCGCGATCYC